MENHHFWYRSGHGGGWSCGYCRNARVSYICFIFSSEIIIGDTSSNGGFPIAMLVYWSVTQCYPAATWRSHRWHWRGPRHGPRGSPSRPNGGWRAAFRTSFGLVKQVSNEKEHYLAILCDLFGMVKWPFSMVKWPPTRGWKGHIESPGIRGLSIPPQSLT